MGPSFLPVLDPDPACYLITWRLLVAGTRVKAKTYQKTWILVTPRWLGRSLLSAHLCFWKGRSRWVMMCPHCMVEGQVGNPGPHWTATSKSCSRVLHRDTSSCQNSLHVKRHLLSTRLISSSTTQGQPTPPELSLFMLIWAKSVCYALLQHVDISFHFFVYISESIH